MSQESLPVLEQKWSFEPGAMNDRRIQKEFAIIDEDGYIVMGMANMTEEVVRHIIRLHNSTIPQGG